MNKIKHYNEVIFILSLLLYRIIFVPIVILFLIGFNSQSFGETFGIENDENGGDCNEIGIWDNTRKTCYLNRDLAINDQILIINTNGVTLDGQGHRITGDGLSDGIYIGNSNNLKILNLQISNTRNGIFLNNSSDNTIANVTTVWNTENGIWAIHDSDNNIFKNNLSGFNLQHGISIGDADNSFIIDNLITQTKDAIRLEKANYNTVSGNYVWENRVEGIDLHESSENLIYNNNVFETIAISVLDDCEECASQYFMNNVGNYYQVYDEVSEGCSDFDSNGICDEPYIFDEGIDQFPSVEIIQGELPNPYIHNFPLKFDDWGSKEKSLGSENFIDDWKQNLALWYYEGAISEQDFLTAIEYLVKNEIIKISSISISEPLEETISENVKVKLGLWGFGLVDNNEFIKILHYFAEKGIISS